MQENEKAFLGYEKIASRFGGWPSFHDCEVISIHAARDEGQELTGPVITFRIHVFNINAAASDPSRNDSIVTLIFRGAEAFELSSFDHQNAISDLLISKRHSKILNGDVFDIIFKKGSGMQCSFSCNAIEIESVEPFSPKWGAWKS